MRSAKVICDISRESGLPRLSRGPIGIFRISNSSRSVTLWPRGLSGCRRPRARVLARSASSWATQTW
eukprot:15236338-Alexandrium_andersonii.AAC.1